MFERGDVVQIRQGKTIWVGCLGIVDEPKPWGAQVVIVAPGEESLTLYYYRASNEDLELVGHTDNVPDI